MKKELLEKAAKYSAARRRRQAWRKIVTIMAAVVVFCTTYALILPAITLEYTDCDLQVHAHTQDCYAQVNAVEQTVLSCNQGDALHTHAESCLSEEGQYACGYADYFVHAHDAYCCDTAGNLACQLPEVEAHEHGDACYAAGEPQFVSEGHTHGDSCYAAELGALLCQLPETEGHTHGDACYALEPGALLCQLPETEGHTHADACYASSQEPACTPVPEEEHTHTDDCYPLVLVCTQEEQAAHAHGEACYEQSGVLICTQEEQAAHTHGEACYEQSSVLICMEEETPAETLPGEPVLVCEKEEIVLHTHAEACFDAEGNLICAQTEVREHQHTEPCMAVIQVSADVETLTCTVTDESHEHAAMCYGTWELVCEIPEHSHLDHLPAISQQEQGEVDYIIGLIDAIPSADEIDAQLLKCEESGDQEGYEAYYAEVVQEVGAAYSDYAVLLDDLKLYVTNADKLLELEYIWSAAILIDKITSDAPTAIKSASTKEFIELNLYDYNSSINTNWRSNNAWPGFQWNGGAYHGTYVWNGNRYQSSYNRHNIDFIDFGNSMITDFEYGSGQYSAFGNSISVNYQNVGNQGGNINAIVEYPSKDYANKPVGMSNGTEVLSRTLTAAGYPWVINAGSMVDYFSESSFADKKNTSSIDGLFQINSTTGEYYYNSRWNHAQYGSNKFTLYSDIITPNFITYPFGNFLPLNTITDSSKATQVSKITHVGGGGTNGTGYMQSIINRLLEGTEDATEQQLIDMLAKYRTNLGGSEATSSNWHTWTAKDAIYDYILNGPTDDSGPITDALLEKMYNIDYDVDTNFFFGMEMKMTFMQPKDGLTGYDNGNNTTGTWATNANGDKYLTGDPDGISDYPMIFYFTGDDDVWVYIDGVLFLDLSGIHRHVGGEIDFVNGQVHYYYLDTATGDVATTPYATYTFAELLEAAGASTDCLNSNGTFKDYTSHTFNFYYMERGSGSSVCRLNFNFPLLRQNSISVAKDVSADTDIMGDPDYKFQVLKANSDGTKTSDLFIGANVEYTVYDTNNKQIGTGTTDANGVFTLKAGQRAEFAGIEENSGKYYVRELLEGTILEQYGNVTVSGESTTTSNNITVGSDTFTGMDSPVKDMSDGTTLFRFTNDVDETKLGSLSVAKIVDEFDSVIADRSFDIAVTLDGEKLPVGTAYTVGSEARTVATDGIITIKAGESAVISNILAGSVFTVQETSDSAKGYVVTYNDPDGNTVTTTDGIATGVIKTNASVELVVNNTEKGTAVTVNGSKSFLKPDGAAHSYSFRLTEVTDQTGGTTKGEAATTSVSVTDTGQFSFELRYGDVDPGVYYYKITEDAAADSLRNADYYVIAVTVTEDGDGNLSAAVTDIWKNGEAYAGETLEFVNTLVGDLSISKTVSGGSEKTEFNFTVSLAATGSGLSALADSYSATLYHQDGTVEPATLPFTDGSLSFTMKHGERIVIHGIPYGAAWTVTETNSKGYIVSYSIDGGAEADGYTAEGTVDTGGTAVEFINTASYELPETGGIGTTVYTMAGLALSIGASGLLYRKKKRRKEADSS